MSNGCSPQGALSNALLNTARIENLILGGFACGACLLTVHRVFRKAAEARGGRLAKVFVELQRKSFHMFGGCLICAIYHWGVKSGFLASAFQAQNDEQMLASPSSTSRPMDAGIAFLSVSLATWMLEASRLMIPAVQRWYLASFRGLVREKELKKAAGIAYFLPGALAAMLAAPSSIAVLGILFLSVGDAAASIGTAAGYIPVGASSRKVEGSIGCFAVCALLGIYAGLSSQVAITASTMVTLGEVLAEVIGLDDNFVIPMLGVLGIRFGICPQVGRMVAMMGTGLSIGVILGLVVGSTTSKNVKE